MHTDSVLCCIYTSTIFIFNFLRTNRMCWCCFFWGFTACMHAVKPQIIVALCFIICLLIATNNA